MNRLQEAIEQWVRAEFVFRMGPMAFSDQTANWLVLAEENLRAQVTDGKTDLREAAKALGVRVERVEPTTTKPKPKPAPAKPVERKRLKVGLFDK